MQKIIAKYGTAAHLAILAVAPLFLFPHYDAAAVADVQFWLALFGFVWIFMEPSMRKGEMLHDARRRVARSVARDPLFWLLLALVIVAGLRALNTGVGMVYDSEASRWIFAEAPVEFIPGCATGVGYLPFVVSVTALVVIVGCRHALGGSARMAFCLVSSVLAGMAGLVAVYDVNQGGPLVLTACACTLRDTSFVGTVFLSYLLFGTLAVMGAFERKWFRVIPLFLFSVGGTAAAGFVFSPARNFALFALVELVLIVYVVVFAMLRLSAATEFKFLVIMVLSLAIGGILVMGSVPSSMLSARMGVLTSGDFLPADFLTLRATLSDISLRILKTAPWLGSGVGTYQTALKFNAVPADWAVVPPGMTSLANGYWLLLAERGIVGATLLLLPVGFLLFTYGRRAVDGIRALELPHPAVLIGPLLLLAVVVAGLYDASFLRGEVLVAVGASLALSANSFPKSNKVK